MRIANVDIGPGHPCRVVAEVSNNHNGSLDLAKRLIRESVSAGADLVKFQCYSVDELVRLRGDGPAPDPWGSQGWSMRDLYEKAQTPHAWFPELVGECQRVGVAWFSSVFGLDSLALLDRLGCPAYKIAALDSHKMLGIHVGASLTDRPRTVIASSRGERIPWADLTLYCPPGYPQDWRFTLDTMQAALDGWALDGVSFHGTDVALLLDVMAAARSPSLVEVHVQLDDTPSELEANVSLTVSQLAQLCEAAKGARVA